MQEDHERVERVRQSRLIFLKKIKALKKKKTMKKKEVNASAFELEVLSPKDLVLLVAKHKFFVNV